MAQQNVIKVGLEISDNGTLQVSKKQAEQLRKAIEEGTKASLLLSRGIADPKKEEALRAQVKLAKDLTNEINRTVSQSKAASRALSSIGGGMAGTMAGGMSGLPPGLERGTAAANTRGGTRDFARQAQGMGGLVHLYATFAANIWSVQAAYMALSTAFEQSRMEKAAEMMSISVGINMKNLAQDIREVSGYAVDLKDALQFGALGTQAGLTTKQITGLITAAKGAANVLGRDVNDSINRMIRGTAKMEQEILDELGIFVRAKDAYKEYSKQLGYTSEDMLTQSERVKAYANAVIKASEKYKDFANIEDPFSKLGATIKDAGRDLLNIVNTVITPFIQSLSESGNLVQGLILAGAAYLTKLAVPALKSFKDSLSDTSKLQREAATANANKLLEMEHQLEESRSKMFTLPPGISTGLSKNFGKAIDDAKIDEKIQKAFLTATDSGTFRDKLTASLAKTASGKELAARGFESRGNIERANTLREEAALIKAQSKELTDRLAKDSRITQLIDQRTRSTKEQLELETLITKAKQDQAALNTRAQQALIAQEKKNQAAASTSKFLAGALPAAFGLGEEKIPDLLKNMKDAWKDLGEGASGVQKVFRQVGAVTQILSAGLDILLKAISRVLMVMLAWDLVISPIFKKLGLITDSGEQAKQSIEEFTSAIESSEKTLKLHQNTLDKSAGNLDVLIKSYNSLSTSIEGVGDSMLMSISDTSTALGKMTGLDRVGDALKGLFGFGIQDSLDKQNKKLKEYLTNLGATPEVVDRLTKSQEELAKANQMVEKTREKYISSQQSRTTSADNKLLSGENYANAVEKQRLASSKVLEDQKAITNEFVKQVAASREAASILESFKTIQEAGKVAESLLSYDPKAFRFKTEELKAADDSIGSVIGKVERLNNLNTMKEGGKTLLENLSEPEQKGIIEGTSKAIGQLDDSLVLLKASIKDPAFIKLYADFVNASKAAFAGQGMDSAAVANMTEKAVALRDKLQKMDKEKIEQDKSQSQIEAASNKAAEELARVRQKMADWEKDAQTRRVNAAKDELQLIQAKNKLIMDSQVFQTKEQLALERNQQASILAQEKELDLAKLKFEYEKDTRFIRKGSIEQSKLDEVYAQQKALIDTQYKTKEQILSIDNKLAERAQARLEYEKTINTEISRGIDLAQARLEGTFSTGGMSKEAYQENKYKLSSAKIIQDRLAAIREAEIAGPVNIESEMANPNSKLGAKLKDLDIAQEKLDIENQTTTTLRKREEILGNLSNQENLITSILEKQEGRGIFNIDLINQLTQTKLTKINEELSVATTEFEKQQLQLEAMNVLYEGQLRMHEAMKRNFLDLTPDQMASVAVNEATLQVDRFRASMKDLVTGTFDAVYAGFDAGIEELTTKIMDGSEIKLKDLITTVRNSMAEEFRKLAADQMKLGVRQIGASIMQAITDKPTDLRTIEQQQLGYLQQIAANTSTMAMGQSFGTGSSLFDYTSQDGKSVSYDLEGKMKVFDETSNTWVESTQTAAKEVAGITNGVLGNFGGTVMQVFNGLGGGIIGLLQPILSLMGISIPGGMGGTGLLGSVAGIFGNIDLTGALGSVFGTSGVGGWLSGLPSTIAGIFGFANGGVMTDYGPLKLNKYSKGGIADSPQLALYGEGRKNEAYVPLPDNRSIPVTLNGGAGGDNVSFNITVNDNSTITSSQEGESSNKERQQGYQDFSKLIAQKVREEMVNQKRPGGLLYGG